MIHTVGGSRARRPLRSIVDHHLAAYRYAAKWWHGPRRLLLPLVAVFLTARGAVVGAARGDPDASRKSGGHRVT